MLSLKMIDKLKIPEGIIIPRLGGLLYDLSSNFERKIVRDLSLFELSLNSSPRDEKIIVSLTSFPERIETVGFAIISLFNQTVKPDRIVLWLAEDQFRDKVLPPHIAELRERGLEIYFCDDLRSHKKYHYILQSQMPEELVVTYDDDIIYPEDSIEKLIKYHHKFPQSIIANRAECCYNDAGKISSYSTWRVRDNSKVGLECTDLFPSTGGGTLYPYGSVNSEAFNVSVMKKNALYADDIWMRFMSALNHTTVVKTTRNNRPFSTIEKEQRYSLQVNNCLHGGNDMAIENLSKRYPQAVKNILSL